MKNHYLWPLMASLFLLAASLFASETETRQLNNSPKPYAAELELTYNGKLQSRPIAKLESLGNDRFRYTLTATGDKGLAWLARAEDIETGEFLWNQGFPKPLIFQRKLKYIGKNDNWFAAFNWQVMQISIRHNDETFELKLKPKTLDPITFLFSMQHAVANGETEFNFPFLDKDEIEHKRFRISGRENLQTAFGCLPTIKIERIRKKPGKFQYHWLAPDFEHIVVRTDTGKVGKNLVRLELKKLSYQGKSVESRDRCQNT